ncbi:polysaccharide deacetylase family protein [Pseudarthrobacter cellobiosi]|uniref:polysaccharide deacetylase family protein n=1 Tax=Pseudarthrobacter cellobiosi TaxID=2953654 RepID=UPI00208FC1D1|nr:polysaccharide deacetylase family protein [Pseudarthrobacter sp. HLT1-5]MCO4254178.1 polysaccharide deacetylase family protein [Pseudarthrobacter sp. HLT1-5]
MAHDEIRPITEVTAAPVTLQHKLCVLSSSSDSDACSSAASCSSRRPSVSNCGPAAVTLPISGSGRRRVVAVAVVLALVVLAVVTAVVIAAQPGRPPPVTVPPVPVPTQPEPTQTEPSAPLPAEPVTPSLRGHDLTVLPGAGRAVALTFDAGSNAAGLPKILSTLSAKGVAGTFFLTGNWAATNPGGVSQIVAAGHSVGNHSMTHPGFTSLSYELITQQVIEAEQAISAAGPDARSFFRFPYCGRDARTIAAVNDLGYVAIRWTVDTLGWKGTSGGISTQTVTDRVLAALQSGEIVLRHIGSNPDDGSTLDADALPHDRPHQRRRLRLRHP